MRMSSDSMKDVVANDQQVPVEAWFLTFVVFSCTTGENWYPKVILVELLSLFLWETAGSERITARLITISFFISLNYKDILNVLKIEIFSGGKSVFNHVCIKPRYLFNRKGRREGAEDAEDCVLRDLCDLSGEKKGLYYLNEG
jgi:hypothetical protein